jgi:hypothetical protein
MSEREGFGHLERFDQLARVQSELEQRGLFIHPVPKEHTEGLVVGPLLQRLRTQIKKRGFGNVAGHVAITFSGLAFDEREIFAIPEVRAYWRVLDQQLPELPALLAIIPALRLNGPGQHVMLLGEVDAVVRHPAAQRYDLHVVEGPQLFFRVLPLSTEVSLELKYRSAKQGIYPTAHLRHRQFEPDVRAQCTQAVHEKACDKVPDLLMTRSRDELGNNRMQLLCR